MNKNAKAAATLLHSQQITPCMTILKPHHSLFSLTCIHKYNISLFKYDERVFFGISCSARTLSKTTSRKTFFISIRNRAFFSVLLLLWALWKEVSKLAFQHCFPTVYTNLQRQTATDKLFPVENYWNYQEIIEIINKFCSNKSHVRIGENNNQNVGGMEIHRKSGDCVSKTNHLHTKSKNVKLYCARNRTNDNYRSLWGLKARVWCLLFSNAKLRKANGEIWGPKKGKQSGRRKT